MDLCTGSRCYYLPSLLLLLAALNAACSFSLPSLCGREEKVSSTKASSPWRHQCTPAPSALQECAGAGTATQLRTPPCRSSQSKRKGIPCSILRIESPLKCLWWYLCAEGCVTTWQSGKPEAQHQWVAIVQDKKLHWQQGKGLRLESKTHPGVFYVGP